MLYQINVGKADGACSGSMGDQGEYKILLGKPQGNYATSGCHGGEDVDVFFWVVTYESTWRYCLRNIDRREATT
jgi:hypothetical protein